MTALSSVYLDAPGLYCFAGAGPETLWRAMLSDAAPPIPLEGADADWPCRAAYTVNEPDVRALGIDRKLQRTLEKQARLGLFGAGLSLARADRLAYPADRTGLYLGLPMVDEAVPPLAVLGTYGAMPEGADLAGIFLREIPPFSGLTLLNSSTCAHISATFGLTGAMAVFSPSNDAGAEALIEGALSLAEGENDMALVGGVSPKVNPLLLLQLELSGQSPVRLGEAAAFLTLVRNMPGETAIRLAGFGRGFGATPLMRETAMATVIRQALDMAEISSSNLDWVITDDPSLRVSGVTFKPGFPVCGTAGHTGKLGPAQPLTHVLLAMQGLATSRRLRRGADGAGWTGTGWTGAAWTEEVVAMRNVLVVTTGSHGQLIALVLQGEKI
jgi:hypothetical protein